MKRKQRKGFTLVELVVVIVVLGILATIAVPRVFGAIEDAKLSAYKMTAAQILDAAYFYQVDFYAGTAEFRNSTNLLDAVAEKTGIDRSTLAYTFGLGDKKKTSEGEVWGIHYNLTTNSISVYRKGISEPLVTR